MSLLIAHLLLSMILPPLASANAPQRSKSGSAEKPKTWVWPLPELFSLTKVGHVVLRPAFLRRGLDHIGVIEESQRAEVLGQAVDLAVLAYEGIDQVREVIVLASSGLLQGRG